MLTKLFAVFSRNIAEKICNKAMLCVYISAKYCKVWSTFGQVISKTKRVLFLHATAAIAVACLSHRNSVCLSGGSVKNGASWDHQIFTVGCLEDSSFRNRKAFS